MKLALEHYVQRFIQIDLLRCKVLLISRVRDTPNNAMFFPMT